MRHRRAADRSRAPRRRLRPPSADRRPRARARCRRAPAPTSASAFSAAWNDFSASGGLYFSRNSRPQAVSTIAGSPPARSASRKKVLASRATVERVRRAPRAEQHGRIRGRRALLEDAVQQRIGFASPRRRSSDRAARARARRRRPARARRSARAAPAPRGTCRARSGSCASTTAAAGSDGAARRRHLLRFVALAVRERRGRGRAKSAGPSLA